MIMTIRVKENYEKKVFPYFFKELGYKNTMAIPRISKVTINIGLGSQMKSESNQKEILETVKQDIVSITGQKPVETKSKDSIAGFGTRKGQILGLKVVLRGKRMADFIDRFVNFVLPRTRDFSGISLTSFDEAGNLNIGIKEHTAFPEIGTGKQAQKVKKIFGLQVTFSTTARDKNHGIALFKALGFPLKKVEEGEEHLIR